MIAMIYIYFIGESEIMYHFILVRQAGRQIDKQAVSLSCNIEQDLYGNVM